MCSESYDVGVLHCNQREFKYLMLERVDGGHAYKVLPELMLKLHPSNREGGEATASERPRADLVVFGFRTDTQRDGTERDRSKLSRYCGNI